MLFHMWSFLHYFMMIGPFVFAFILWKVFKNKEYDTKRKVGLILSWAAVITLIIRNIDVFQVSGFKITEELFPLQVCHFANFVLLYAFYKKSDSAFGFAFLFNLPLAYLSLVFADGLENYSSILNPRGFAYIIGHMLIVITSLYAFSTGFVKLSYRKYVSIAKIIATIFILSIFVNNLFRIVFHLNSNYFYTEHPEYGTPLELFYNMGSKLSFGQFEINIIYMILLFFAGLIGTFLLFMIVMMLQKKEIKNTRI